MQKTNHPFDIKRHDLSTDRSLRPYSAADEYLLSSFNSLENKPNTLAIYHDRFGFLTCNLHAHHPITVFTNQSQIKAIELNTKANQLPLPQLANPLESIDRKIDFAIMKVPKSLALFQLYLEHITQNSSENVTIVCAFMTRHFSPKLIQIAEKYFENATQSRAVKKARLLTLTHKKAIEKSDIIDELDYEGTTYKQYWGVFSAKHIDYATQYFLEHIELNASDEHILDLAAGNGVIAKEIAKKRPDTEIHLMDDFYLAVESAKLNLASAQIHHHFDNDLSSFEDETFDLITTNPPFHFEYEINIKIPIQLFKECFRCLKSAGNLQIVANKHLNYQTHLRTIFPVVEVLAENDKFVIYKCAKTSNGE